MPTDPYAGLIPYLVPLLVVLLILRRALRPRRLRVEYLWVLPTLLLLVTLAGVIARPPGPVIAAVMAAALAVGAVAGWWRGRLTTITVDPETHALTSQPSRLGVILIAALFAARYGLRIYLVQSGQVGRSGFGQHAAAATDGLLLLSVGLVCTQRLEMWLRARRLLAEARAQR
jgi:hypothetical protein